MTRTRLKSRAALLTVLLGAAAAAVMPVSSAIAVDSSPTTWQVEVSPTATLLARGAALSVSVTAQCPSSPFFPTTGLVTVTLSQRQGSITTSASGTATVACTGAPSAETVYVVVKSGDKVFKKGTAFAVATIAQCAFCGGTMDTDSRTVTVSP
jgi:hypothetical protein